MTGSNGSVEAEKKVKEITEENMVVSSVEIDELKPVLERVVECELVPKEMALVSTIEGSLNSGNKSLWRLRAFGLLRSRVVGRGL
ncbi:hypothetical protein J5N97_010093 [Dioscorea zingiberensis]|uniref:Uncharacterized protein n=1 Tax=Dioscorea zingiberensis TaxID=325984 RepID=A0A9D5CYR6_9LILI|nr:hypothetical protein J5N97_010093 [Dioscorea zingiberensis]